jgi:polyhydroxybutyrate depolymerase
MKKLLVFILLCPLFAAAQQTNHSFMFDGVQRDYIQYVPASYNGSTAVPIVFALHGLGDNMTNFANVGLNYVADTANFIVIVPQALVDPFVGASAWNSGAGISGFTLNSQVDDIGFIGAILDSLESNFNIDNRRLYACGFSMGGFMSHRLACEMNDRFAAIASVAGTIGGGITCTPGRAVPVCHFHGSGDATVAYVNNNYGMDAAEVVDFWVQNNACNASPIVTSLPDIANDGYTVEHFEYGSCSDNTAVEFFRVDSADHVWLGPSNDIFYTTEIWNFFAKHIHPNANIGVTEQLIVAKTTLYPNPANNAINLMLEATQPTSMQLTILDVTGRTVQRRLSKLTSGENSVQFDVSTLNSGIYFLRLTNDKYTETLEFVVSH